MIDVPRSEGRAVADIAGGYVSRSCAVCALTVRSLIAGNPGAVVWQVVARDAAVAVEDGVGTVAAWGTGRSDGTGPADSLMAHAAGGSEGALGPVAVPPLQVVPVDVFAGPGRGVGSPVVMAGFATSR